MSNSFQNFDIKLLKLKKIDRGLMNLSYLAELPSAGSNLTHRFKDKGS